MNVSRFDLLWSGARANPPSGVVLPDAGASVLTPIGTYGLTDTTGFSSAIGSARIDRAINNPAVFTFANPGPAGDILWRILTYYNPEVPTTVRMILQDGISGSNYVWVWGTASSINARVYDTGANAALLVQGARFVAADIPSGSPILIDAGSIGGVRFIVVNSLETLLSGPAYLGSTSGAGRVGIRETGEGWNAPIVAIGRASGGRAGWWSLEQHDADCNALGLITG
jgi:hypothetical protein